MPDFEQPWMEKKKKIRKIDVTAKHEYNTFIYQTFIVLKQEDIFHWWDTLIF